MIRLPDEVWHTIFSYFECTYPDAKWTEFRDKVNHDPLSVLLSLSLVCHQFYRVAQGLLYRIILAGKRDDELDRQALLARTLASQPLLGLGVRSVTIDDVEWPRDDGLSSLLEWRLASLSMPDTFKMLRQRDMQTASPNVIPLTRNNLTAFILVMTPHVKLVDIAYNYPSSTLFWVLGGSLGMPREIAPAGSGETNGDGSQQAHNGQVVETLANHLPNLQELRLRGDGYGSAMGPSPPFNDFKCSLLHPNLRTLRAHGFHWLFFERETRLWANLPIRIQRLDLVDAIIDAATIRHILTICKDLRTLYITLGSARKAGFEVMWEMNMHEVGQALRAVGRDLLEFGLKTDGYEEHHACRGRIGSLDGMPDLQHLSVTKENLVGPHGHEGTLLLNEALPESLVSLCLYSEYHLAPDADYPDVFQEVNDEVCGVLVGGEFPELREVTMLRFCDEEKVRGGEFGGTVEGWNLLETMEFEEGYNPKRRMHVNTYLTRKKGYEPLGYD